MYLVTWIDGNYSEDYEIFASKRDAEKKIHELIHEYDGIDSNDISVYLISKELTFESEITIND